MNPRNILGHAVVHDTARQRVLAGLHAEARAAATFCCGPCAKGQHDRCLSDQPCDCPGCHQPTSSVSPEPTASAATPSGLPSVGVMRVRGRQGML